MASTRKRRLLLTHLFYTVCILVLLLDHGLLILCEAQDVNYSAPEQESSDLDQLADALVNSVRLSPHKWPALTGYCGWNYECATLLYALQIDNDLGMGLFGTTPTEIRDFLQAATEFPQPGFWPVFAPWLLTPGDRIGLFGSL